MVMLHIFGTCIRFRDKFHQPQQLFMLLEIGLVLYTSTKGYDLL